MNPKPSFEAGTIKFEHDGEHGGAFEFSLGRDHLFLGQLPGSIGLGFRVSGLVPIGGFRQFACKD